MKEVGIDISKQRPKDITGDPKGKSIEKIREIRDEIQERVRWLIPSLPKEN